MSSMDDINHIARSACNVGLTHRLRKFLLKRKSRSDRVQAKLAEVKEELRHRRHQPIPEQGKWLAQVVA